MDVLDEKLLQLLSQDARKSSKTLAKQLNVNEATIRRRIKKLLESGVLRIIGVTDPTAIGFPLLAVIAFDVAHQNIDSAIDALASRSEVKWVSSVTGPFDIIAVARFRSTDELYGFMQKEVAHLEGLRDSQTFICLHTTKGQYL